MKPFKLNRNVLMQNMNNATIIDQRNPFEAIAKEALNISNRMKMNCACSVNILPNGIQTVQIVNNSIEISFE